MPHTAEDWKRWGRNRPAEEQHLVALDVTKEPQRVIWLPPGGADKPLPDDAEDRTPVNLRAKRGDFHCLVDGCGPFQTAVATTIRRHHFRHHAAPIGGRPGHDPETIDHANAKHALAAWLRQSLGEHLAHLSIDEDRITTSRGTVKPDVYAVLDTGVRIAIEYQHSPGDAQVVDAKRIIYGSEGITCWWLFGPYRNTCRRIEPPPDSGWQPTFDPTPVQANLIRGGVGFHWFSAEHRLIATPFNLARRYIQPCYEDEDWPEPHPRTTRIYPQRPWPKANWVLMEAADLADCRVNLDTGELVTPTDDDIRRRWRAGDAEIRHLRSQARQRQLERFAAERPPRVVTQEPVLDAAEPEEPNLRGKSEQDGVNDVDHECPAAIGEPSVTSTLPLVDEVDQDNLVVAEARPGHQHVIALPTASTCMPAAVTANTTDSPRKSWWRRLIGKLWS